MIASVLVIIVFALAIWFLANIMAYEGSYNYWKYSKQIIYNSYWVLNNNLIVKITKTDDYFHVYFNDEQGNRVTRCYGTESLEMSPKAFCQSIIRKSNEDEFKMRIEKNKILKEMEK